MLATHFGDAVALGIEADFQAIDFDEQYRFGIEREAEVEGFFDGDENPLVHHFESGRDDARTDDRTDGLRGIVDAFEDAKHRAYALRIARKTDPDLGDDAECAFATDDRADKVRPGGFFNRAADLDDVAIGGDQLDAEDVIHGDAVLERVRA